MRMLKFVFIVLLLILIILLRFLNVLFKMDALRGNSKTLNYDNLKYIQKKNMQIKVKKYNSVKKEKTNKPGHPKAQVLE